MAKRSAGSDLNHENWAEEESSEEQGVFQKASAEELGKRVIKTARRRNPRLGNESTKGAFAGFEGFKVASSTTPGSVSFNFGSASKSSSSNGTSNESASIKSTQASTSFILSHNPITTATSTIPSSTTTTTTKTDKTNTESSHSTEYYGQLKSLNESVSAWIKSHVDKNPICILTPIFRDYEKYLAEIEETEQKKTKGDSKKDSSAEKKEEGKPDTTKSSSDKTFSFALGQNFSATSTPSSTTTITSKSSFFSSTSTFQSSSKSDAPGSSLGSGFLFGKKAEESKDQNIKNEVNPFLSGSSQTFNFGQSQGSTGGFSSTFPSAGFTFGGSSTFASTPKVESTEGNTADKEEDDDETPKDEFKPIVEEDALYTKRCKLFAKKEGKYNECGIGTLHIKPVPGSDDDDDSKKIQVVVRADNAIGTVLLNVVLGGSSKLPAPTRVGKNNVMLVCPLPSEADNVPLPVLVRVKEEKDADELFSQLTELD
ncbi:hypothetical protein J437_LFUL006358 [Ladona fulva]|uniref:RanBD1 domain-containing protein n=1 Tax=Ladona fulva TaxID=123851 RepID=A0A8K0NZF1_LADFU|nr:hypothetical protein J437_LFUL006358 [Ladona fulva]